MWNSTNGDRITIPSSGIYCFGMHGRFDANATGQRHGAITLNDAEGDGGWVAINAHPADTTLEGYFQCAATRLMTAGDILRASVYQNSTGDLNVDSVIGPRFWCFKVSD